MNKHAIRLVLLSNFVFSSPVLVMFCGRYSPMCLHVRVPQILRSLQSPAAVTVRPLPAGSCSLLALHHTVAFRAPHRSDHCASSSSSASRQFVGAGAEGGEFSFHFCCRRCFCFCCCRSSGERPSVWDRGVRSWEGGGGDGGARIQ